MTDSVAKRQRVEQKKTILQKLTSGPLSVVLGFLDKRSFAQVTRISKAWTEWRSQLVLVKSVLLNDQQRVQRLMECEAELEAIRLVQARDVATLGALHATAMVKLLNQQQAERKATDDERRLRERDSNNIINDGDCAEERDAVLELVRTNGDKPVVVFEENLQQMGLQWCMQDEDCKCGLRLCVKRAAEVDWPLDIVATESYARYGVQSQHSCGVRDAQPDEDDLDDEYVNVCFDEDCVWHPDAGEDGQCEQSELDISLVEDETLWDHPVIKQINHKIGDHHSLFWMVERHVRTYLIHKKRD